MFILRVHREVGIEIRRVVETAPIVQHLQALEGNVGLLPNGHQGDLGFGGCLKRLGEDREFVEYGANIPVIRSDGLPCGMCRGKRSEDRRCLYCNDRGFENVYNFAEAERLIRSLYLYLTALNYLDYETSCQLPHLMTISLGIDKKQSGRGVSGEFGIEFTQWLGRLVPSKCRDGISLPFVEAAMLEARNQMINSSPSEFEIYDFRTQVSKEGRLHLNVPGNACGIDPEGGAKGEGYEFGPHNMDTLFQQISILAGLGTLCLRARAEMAKK